MNFVVFGSIYILTEYLLGTCGLDCLHYTPFQLRRSEDDTIIEQTFATVRTKTCKDHEQCSRLRITDITNETYTALDCIDRSVCESPESWCNGFTENLFTMCEINCCIGNLCAEINRTKSVETKNRPNIQRATCSIFTPFRVDIESKEVTEVYNQLEPKVCELDETCSGVILTDRNNKTHQASACVDHNHCKNPDGFCKALIEGTNGTFVACELKCCGKSFCLENKKSNETFSKCFEHIPFSLDGDKVKLSSHSARMKTCKKDELCSRATFTDRENNTHISLDCIAKSVCDNASILCQHFSKTNQQSPFVKCDVECCMDNLCYSDSISRSPSTPSTFTPSTFTPSTSAPRTTPPTVATPSSTTKLQPHIRIISLAVLFYIFLDTLLQYS